MLLHILSGPSRKWQLKKHVKRKLFEWILLGRYARNTNVDLNEKLADIPPGYLLFFLYSAVPYLPLLCGTSHNAFIQRYSISALWRNTTSHRSSVFCPPLKSVGSVFCGKSRLARSLIYPERWQVLTQFMLTSNIWLYQLFKRRKDQVV